MIRTERGPLGEGQDERVQYEDRDGGVSEQTIT